MAGEMCTIYPSVKGKKSKLYVDMYNKTGHDRKLTNFLYAMSKLDDVRAKFSKDQFDRLGEIKSKDFMEWVDIDKLIAGMGAYVVSEESISHLTKKFKVGVLNQ
jgi:nitrous oxide reductase